MKSAFFKNSLIALYLFLGSSVAISAPLCGQVFSSVKPFSVTSPGLMGKILGSFKSSEWHVSKYGEVLKYAQTNSDFIDLFASFRENKVPYSIQGEILKNHPRLKSLNATESLIKDYVQKYNSGLDKVLLESPDSPLFKELSSPKVVDQCSSGTCWINASTSVLENALSDANQIDISEQFIYLKSLIHRSLESSRQNSPFYEGGDFAEYLKFVTKDGYVLSSDWTPNKNIYQHNNEIITALNVVVSQYRSIFSFLSKSFHPEDNLEEAQRNFISDAEAAITNIIGPLPEKHLVKQLPPHLVFESIERRDLSQSFNVILSKIADNVDAGKEVYISLNSKPQDFAQKDVLEKSMGGYQTSHAMSVVGYIKDSSGTVQLLKIKNSWGKNIGDGGFIYLSNFFINQSFVKAGVLNHR